MKRRTFDLMVSWGGLILAAVFAVSGVLLLVGYNYANSTVHDQLASQQIYFPAAGSDQLKDPAIGPYLTQYSTPTQVVNGETVGQQLVNGQQAEAYANHYIAAHLAPIGMTYSQASAASRADPENAELKATVDTLFRGETLRGLLLDAYAFWKMGQIALWAAIGAFIAAAALAFFSILGFWHLRKVNPEVEIGVPQEEKNLKAVAS
jgi:hypothetical protein